MQIAEITGVWKHEKTAHFNFYSKFLKKYELLFKA